MTAPAAEKDAAKPTGTKRNHANSWESEAKTETEAFPKKSRLEEKVHVSPLKHLTGALLSHDPEKCVTPLQVGDESNIKQETSVDIMSIVRGTGLRSFKGHESQNIANKALIGGENVAGLRIKKIMRRTNKDKESSILVQKLRKEIREAVKDRSSKDIEEHVLDPTLLAAFRAVVAGPGVESVKKLSPLAVKAKKSLLQKGKIRESLTKKIYGSSNGRRKRAWDRDCEVEFWKYRCMRTAKPQKIETLKSVLGLLRKEPASSEIVEDSDQRSSNSILSRLYLADTSVLPRKNDIKPVSCTDSIAKSENEKEHIVLRQKSVGHSVKTAETSKVTASSNISLEPGIKVPSSRHDSPVSKVPPKRLPEGSSGSCVDNLKCDGRKDMTANSDNSKSDKRKWALEILARRTSVGKSAASDGHEDNVLLKGNFPLLAQLPADMRPVLSPARHNKVPISVRQAQLYRLTEHFLRRANLQSICRTAETELAVADAINIERMAADRSSSKLVYLNLCSQELRHRPEGCKSSGATEVATESTPSSPSVASHEKPEEGMEEYSDPEVGVALRAAGLLSDSPPNSPSPKCMVPDGENYPSADAGDKGPDDAFELGCETCTDISGDFKNGPGEEDRVDSCTMEVSEQTEDSLSKMKDVSSTFDSENSKLASDSKCPDISMSESSKCTTSCVEDAHNMPCEPHKSLAGDGGEHPAFVECEKLYDPDKEFSMNKFPDRSSGMKNDPTETGFQDEINVPVDDEACASSQEVAQSAGVIVNVESSGGKQPNASVSSEGGEVEQEQRKKHDKAQHDVDSIKRKVEAYIKEHIRPLCKSGVISVEQYRWSVMKTVDKIMKYHCKAKNANFLIKEGEKVKRLAEQYVEASQQKG